MLLLASSVFVRCGVSLVRRYSLVPRSYHSREFVTTAEVSSQWPLNVVSYCLILHGGKLDATHVIVKGDYE